MKKRMAILMSMAIAANMIASVPVCAADIFTDSMTTDSAITQEADDDSFSDGLGTPDFADEQENVQAAQDEGTQSAKEPPEVIAEYESGSFANVCKLKTSLNSRYVEQITGISINGTEWNEVTYSWDLTGTTYIKKDSDGYVGLSPDRLEVGNEIVITSTGYKDLTLKVTGTGKHWNVEKVTSQSEPEQTKDAPTFAGDQVEISGTDYKIIKPADENNVSDYISKIKEISVDGTVWDKTDYAIALYGRKAYCPDSSNNRVVFDSTVLHTGNVITIKSDGYKELYLKVTAEGNDFKVVTADSGETNINGASNGVNTLHVRLKGYFESAVTGQQKYDAVSGASTSVSSNKNSNVVVEAADLPDGQEPVEADWKELKETGVKIRFLAGIRRVILTIIKDQFTSDKYLRENVCVLKAIAKDPYVVGSDFIGEEINDIEDLKPAIMQIVQDIAYYDEGFTVRIHAGENDSLKDNVEKSIKCVEESLRPGQKMPRIRIGHGLYSKDPNTKEGKELIEKMKKTNTIVEFQLTSNIRLNNLSKLENHPIKRFLSEGVKCVQGTDGNGFYGTDTFDEQLALRNLLGVTDAEFEQMRAVEDEVIKQNERFFEEKSRKFEKFLNGRTLRQAILELENEELEKIKNEVGDLRITNTVDSEEVLKYKIKELPLDKIPVIVAGGSFNKKGRVTFVTEQGKNIIDDLVRKLDPKKVFFVIGHKMEGYEKAIIESEIEQGKSFEIYAIIPKKIDEKIKSRLENDNITGIRISTESEELGIYKSFNYEIFERRKSIVLAFDGNSPVSNLVQEAKNGKGKSKVYVNGKNEVLSEKMNNLEGYVVPFSLENDAVDIIIDENPEIC